MLFLVGISITFFLEFLLLSKRNKTLSVRILVVWLFFIGVHLLLFYLRHSPKAFNYPLILGLDLPLPLLHGPLLYFYVSTLTNQYPKRKSIFLLHFIPVLVSYLFMIPFFSLSAADRINVFKHEGQGFELFAFLNFTAIVLSGISYFIWSLILLKKHRKINEIIFSSIENRTLNWLRYLIYGIGFIYLISFFFDEVYLFSAIVIFVIFVGYFGIKQIGIFSEEKVFSDIIQSNQTELPAENSKPEEKRYVKSGLSPEQADTVHRRLEELMQNEELYKNPDINLVELANKVNIHPNYLSQVINEKTGNNFYVYINNLRIQAVLSMIENPQNRNLKLISLAYDCGFSSKSSFNKYFKTIVGKTPSEYLEGIS